MVTATATRATTSVKLPLKTPAVRATKATKAAVAAETEKVAEKVADALTPTTMGKIIDKMFDLREEKRLLDAQVKKKEELIAEQEELLMKRMTAEGMDAAKGKKASASITTGVVASVVDWSKVEAFVKRTNSFQLFQRRISEPAFRELMEKKGAVPGIEPFTKRKINLRVNAA